MVTNGAPRRRVLVVDDNADAARMLGLLLEQLGHEVALAFDGAAAIDIARRVRPDYVFLDLALPGMDGYGVAEALKSEPGFEHVRIVAVTGLAQEAHRSRSLAAGIELFLVKPFDPRFIESLLGDARSGQPKP